MTLTVSLIERLRRKVSMHKPFCIGRKEKAFQLRIKLSRLRTSQHCDTKKVRSKPFRE
jgi:hypothetical protein